MLDRTDRLGLRETFKVVCSPIFLFSLSLLHISPSLKWNVADEQLGSTGNVYVSVSPPIHSEREI